MLKDELSKFEISTKTKKIKVNKQYIPFASVTPEDLWGPGARFVAQSMNITMDELVTQIRSTLNDMTIKKSDPGSSEYKDNLIPLMAPNIDPDKWVLLDKRTGFIVDQNIRLDSVEKIISRTFGKDELANWWAQSITAMTTFKPNGPTTKFSRNQKTINLFRPREWMLEEPEPLDPFFKRYFEHLIAAEHRPYVAAWVVNSLHGKNLTALVLLSEIQGTGKGTFLNIVEHLHTLENAKVVDSKQSISSFNGIMWRSTFIGWDEAILLKDDALAYWKTAITEPRMKFELKKVDAFVDDNHCNFILTTNEAKDIRMEPNDRRWSCPEVTNEPLLPKFSVEQVIHFKNVTLKNNRQLKAFYLWLKEIADPNVTHAIQLKNTAPFWKFCRESNGQRKWLLDLIDEIRNNRYIPKTHPIPRAELERMYKRTFQHSSFPLIGHNKLANFFRQYTPNGSPVAKVSSSGHLEVIGYTPDTAISAL